MSQFGQLGRFANQIFQYMFLKTYARRHGLTVRLRSWVGNELFGTDDRDPVDSYPEFRELYDKYPDRMVIPRLNATLRNVDFFGFFQYPMSYYLPDRDFIQSLFTPVPRFRNVLDEGVKQIRTQGKTLVALHIRRGDYGCSYFYITPVSWYLQWLKKHWSALDNPVLYIATDEPEVVAEFSEFAPITATEVHQPMDCAPYYPDFYTLSQADIVVMPNSSFSFAASMLNRNLQTAYRSHLRSPLLPVPFIEIDPWDSIAIDVEAHIDRYPQIEGIRRVSAEETANQLPKRRKFSQAFRRKLSQIFRRKRAPSESAS